MLPTAIRLEIVRLRNQERLDLAQARHTLTRIPLTTRMLSLVRHTPSQERADTSTSSHIAHVA